MHRDIRPPVATLQRAARRHRDFCYLMTDHSDVDEFTVAITRRPESSTDASGPMSTTNIINRGSTVWPLIVDNRPVDGLDRFWAGAVPEVDGDLQELGLRPNHVQWRVRRVSQYGTSMVDAAVRLRWTFGARQRCGGAYITRMWFDVPTCHVGWAVRLQLGAHVLRGRDVGRLGEPVAGLPIGVVGSISTPLGNESIDWRLAIRGDGSTTRWRSDAR